MLFRLNKYGRTGCVLACIVLFSACATYYEKSSDMMDAIYKGNYTEAHKILDDPKFSKRERDKLLYLLNRGTVYWMMKEYQQSNSYFRLADYYIEDLTKNNGAQALSLLTNPTIKPYRGEPFEQILLHYFTTLNYIKLGKYDEALVECKRMQQKMQQITDAFKNENKYRRDAFAHLLLGIIYDAQQNYNDAFIAYRNALEVYREDYSGLMDSVPMQLKHDLIRTAHLTGFYQEQSSYEHEFGLTYSQPADSSGSVVFLWNNGLGPFKEEWRIDFIISDAGNGNVLLMNTELGISYTYNVGNEEQQKNLTNLKVVSVAFPKYRSRMPLYTQANLFADSLVAGARLELVEPIDAIAYKSLNDRMLKEIGEALLRLAIKQAETLALDKLAEEKRKKKDKDGAAGFEIASSLLTIVNAATEHADTRNWQLLPYSISYTRMELPQGNHKLILHLQGNQVKDEKIMDITIAPGQTTLEYFYSYQFSGFSYK